MNKGGYVMRRVAIILSLAVGIVVGSSTTWVYSAVVNAGANPEVPQLKVLDSFVGKWKGEFHGKGSEQQTKIEGVSEWVLNGRFLLTKNTVTGQNGNESWTMWTYDPKASQYRRWLFTSSGLVMTQRGQWNESTKEFTFMVETEPSADNTVTATTKIVDENTREWTYLFKDQSGKVTGEVIGTNVRQK